MWNLSGTEVAVLKGKSVVFSPDSKFLATSSDDGTVKVWNLSGTEVAVLKGKSVVFSPDSKFLATSSDDGTVKVWNLSGTEVAVLKGESVVFSPDSKFLATARGNNVLSLWSRDGKEFAVLKGQEESVYNNEGEKSYVDYMGNLVFSPDSKFLAALNFSCGDACHPIGAQVWDLSSKKFTILKGEFEDIVFNPTSRFLATGSRSGKVQVWDLKGEEVKNFQGHQDIVQKVIFSPDNRFLASASADSTARIWGMQNIVFKLDAGVQNIVFSSDSKLLSTSSDDGLVRLWDLQHKELSSLNEIPTTASAIAFSPDSTHFLTRYYRNVNIWNLQGKKVTSIDVGEESFTKNVFFIDDGKLLAAVGEDGSVQFWNLQGKKVDSFILHLQTDQKVVSAVFSPDSKLLATVSDDHTVRVWNRQGKEIATFRGHQDIVVFSPDSKLLVTITDGSVQFWNLQGKKVDSFILHLQTDQKVVSAVFSPDSKLLATVGDDHTVRVWNRQGKEIATFRGHQDPHQKFISTFSDVFQKVVFSPDSKLLATITDDGSLRLWNFQGKEAIILTNRKNYRRIQAETLELMYTGASAYQGNNWDIAFSPDGQLLAIINDNSTVHVWQFSTDYNELLTRSCDWLQDYLKNGNGLDLKDRNLCDGI
ncbi:hypothetical protein NIES2111_68460 (plasmid) [Nostoc sp. NIES-2111]|nr:hypothetical protein NIES2111_68460 [Nostoc sp. NIES-2111]